jgi:succinyl-CoA synthetase alpha subunit
MADRVEADKPQGTTDAVQAAQVFISYASQDKGVADAVCQALERAGVACWIAPRNVVPGESYAGAIVHAIDGTKLIVLILSEHGASSQHVLR